MDNLIPIRLTFKDLIDDSPTLELINMTEGIPIYKMNILIENEFFSALSLLRICQKEMRWKDKEKSYFVINELLFPYIPPLNNGKDKWCKYRGCLLKNLPKKFISI